MHGRAVALQEVMDSLWNRSVDPFACCCRQTNDSRRSFSVKKSYQLLRLEQFSFHCSGHSRTQGGFSVKKSHLSLLSQYTFKRELLSPPAGKRLQALGSRASRVSWRSFAARQERALA